MVETVAIPSITLIGPSGRQRKLADWEVLYYIEEFEAVEQGLPFHGYVTHDPDAYVLALKIARAAGRDTRRAEEQMARARERIARVEEEMAAEKANRRVLPDDVRRSVFERDGYQCRHCGDRYSISVDHVIPRAKGGTDGLENLQTLCRPCNSRKGTRIESPEVLGSRE